MTTVVEALQTATLELHNAAVLLQTLAGSVSQNLTQTTTNTTNIINNFLGRPPTIGIFVDPVAGNDNNDGTLARPKKSIDTVLDNIGTTATNIYMLGDVTVRRRRTVYAPLSIFGVQASGNSTGYIFVPRKMAFLGTAENSPIEFTGSFPSGIWFFGPNYRSSYINYEMPTQPAGQDYTAYFTSDVGTTFVITTSTLLVSGAASGSFLGSSTNTLNASLSMTLGSGATGHLFQGVAAGANPNTLFQYHTNITSA